LERSPSKGTRKNTTPKSNLIPNKITKINQAPREYQEAWDCVYTAGLITACEKHITALLDAASKIDGVDYNAEHEKRNAGYSLHRGLGLRE
jgi:hypothetical protein